MVAIAVPQVRASDLIELTKPRIVLMVMITVAAGYWLAAPATYQILTLFHLLLGTAFVAAGTSALNQVAERDIDAVMHRTRSRPVPAGRVSAQTATWFAWLLGVTGVVYLTAFVSSPVGGLAAATLVSYVFLYTPLKRRTTVSTLIGAVPGALPIVGGWVAAEGSLGPEAWVLFWILFLWQLPHFLALGWLYREDYARAGLKMLSVTDPDGRATFWYATVYAAALLPVSLFPTILGIAGRVYFVGAMALSVLFLVACIVATRRVTASNARTVFRASLAYLPLLLILMMANRAL